MYVGQAKTGKRLCENSKQFRNSADSFLLRSQFCCWYKVKERKNIFIILMIKCNELCFEISLERFHIVSISQVQGFASHFNNNEIVYQT